MPRDPWYKNEETDKIWWKDTDYIGEFIFSFDKQHEYNLFQDYPYKLTKEEKRFSIRRTRIGETSLQIVKREAYAQASCSNARCLSFCHTAVPCTLPTFHEKCPPR